MKLNAMKTIGLVMIAAAILLPLRLQAEAPKGVSKPSERPPCKFPDRTELTSLLPTAMVGKDDKSRIIGVMQRALQGNELTIMGIGTSIMAGANASDFKKNGKTVKPTNGKLIIKLDGKQLKEIDPNFKKGWGDWVPNETVFKEDMAEQHTLEFIYSGSQGEPILIKYLLIAE